MTYKLKFSDHSNQLITHLLFSRDSRWLISAEVRNNGVNILDIVTKEQTHFLFTHDKGVASIAVNVDNSLLATGGIDGTIRLWNVADWTQRAMLPFTYKKGVTGLAFDATGAVLVGSSILEDSTFIWDVKKDELRHLLKRGGIILESSIDPLRNAVVITDAGRIDFYSLSTGDIIHSFNDSVDITSVSITPDGNLISYITKDENVKIWNLKQNRLFRTITLNGDGAHFAVFSPSGKYLAVVHIYLPCISIWDIMTGQQIQSICNLNFDRVKSICFNSDETLLAYGLEDQSARESQIEIWQKHATFSNS